MPDRIRELIDIPPTWLLGCLVLAWSQARIFPGAEVARPVLSLIGGLFVGGGVLLAALAIVEMRRQSTSVMPHQVPQALVQSGIFRVSRNPIYLGDLAILCGFCLFWQAWPSLLLVPMLGWILVDRFIVPEETRMQAKFGPIYESYCNRTRRWL